MTSGKSSPPTPRIYTISIFTKLCFVIRLETCLALKSIRSDVFTLVMMTRTTSWQRTGLLRGRERGSAAAGRASNGDAEPRKPRRAQVSKACQRCKKLQKGCSESRPCRRCAPRWAWGMNASRKSPPSAATWTRRRNSLRLPRPPSSRTRPTLLRRGTWLSRQPAIRQCPITRAHSAGSLDLLPPAVVDFCCQRFFEKLGPTIPIPTPEVRSQPGGPERSRHGERGPRVRRPSRPHAPGPPPGRGSRRLLVRGRHPAHECGVRPARL